MNKRRKSVSPGLYGWRSVHIRGIDPFTLRAIKYLARAEGKTIAGVIEWLVDDDLINQYPDLVWARHQHESELARFEETRRYQMERPDLYPRVR